MRVLFTTWAWPSHYYPMVPLAWALRAAGHEVRMTSQPDLLPTMRSSGLPATAIGRDLDVAAAFRAARATALTGQAPAAGPAAARPGARTRHSSAAPDRVTGRLTADAIASEPDNVQLARARRAMATLEDEMGAIFKVLRERQIATSSPGPPLHGELAEVMVDDLLALARSWRPDVVVYDPLTLAGPMVAARIGVPAVRSLFGPDVTYFTDARTPAGLGAATIDLCPPSLQYSSVVCSPNRIHTRYVPYNGLSEVPTWLPDRPSRPRLCLTWGTSIHRLIGERAFLPHEVLTGCVKLADERGAELVLAIAANQRHMLPDLPPHVRVAESVPLDALLPTCTALVHQGGAGTMLTGLRHGLPQIVLSQVFDQAANAFQLAAAGAALTRMVTGLTASDLLTMGHELLDEPGYRLAARNLQQEIRDQPPPAGIVDALATLAVARA